MIWARVVFSPTLVAVIVNVPFLLSVAEMISSPTVFSIGKLSPVTADWSTKPLPLKTVPSTAILSPGRIMRISPSLMSSASIVISFPFFITFAVFGESSTSFPRASLVLPFERVSRNLPTVTSVKIIALDSK